MISYLAGKRSPPVAEGLAGLLYNLRVVGLPVGVREQTKSIKNTGFVVLFLVPQFCPEAHRSITTMIDPVQPIDELEENARPKRSPRTLQHCFFKAAGQGPNSFT